MSHISALIASITNHIGYCIKHRNSSAIKLYIAEQNLTLLVSEINKFYITLKEWALTDTTSYSVFEVVKQDLYLNHSILIEVYQKPMSHPDSNHLDLDTEGYTKIYFDLDLNTSDPKLQADTKFYYADVNS